MTSEVTALQYINTQISALVPATESQTHNTINSVQYFQGTLTEYFTNISIGQGIYIIIICGDKNEPIITAMPNQNQIRFATDFEIIVATQIDSNNYNVGTIVDSCQIRLLKAEQTIYDLFKNNNNIKINHAITRWETNPDLGVITLRMSLTYENLTP